MIELPALPVPIVVPAMLGFYALAFIAGGIYYLEQQVARIRDQFPERGILARLIGYAALSIGILTALSVGGHLLGRGPEFGLGALAATMSGLAFWVVRMHGDPTIRSRVRDGLLAFVCAMLVVLTAWWVTTL
jgi:hypothetical protein